MQMLSLLQRKGRLCNPYHLFAPLMPLISNPFTLRLRFTLLSSIFLADEDTNLYRLYRNISNSRNKFITINQMYFYCKLLGIVGYTLLMQFE